jgi:endo-1,4-beta-xylanase
MRVLQGLMLAAVCAVSGNAQDAGTTPSGRQQASVGSTQQATRAQQSGESKKSSAKKSSAKKPRAPFKWVNPLPGSSVPGLKHATFSSPSLGNDVGYLILLPTDYDGTQQRYPVVYYLHGGRPGSESKSYRLASPIQKLMKSSGMSPVIYVFVNGGPVSHYDMPDDDGAQGASVFIKELIPHIDSTYRTIADRSGRGLEGFSQGGRGTMRLGLRYPDLFCSAAAGGGGYESEKRISDSGGYESPSLRFEKGDNAWDLAKAYGGRRTGPIVNWMIYVGTEGFNYENNLDYMRFLKGIGIKCERLVVPGVPHSASGIYAKAGEEIMRFHINNFKHTQSN